MDIESVRETLRRGVKNIVSHYSPPGLPLENQNHQKSSHYSREICFVLDGHSPFILNGSAYAAQPGDLFILDRWIPHSKGYSNNSEELLHLWITFPKAIMSAVLLHVDTCGNYHSTHKVVTLCPDYHNILVRRWNQLLLEKEINPKVVSDFMTQPLNAVLDEIGRLICVENKADTCPEDLLVATVKNYIRQANGNRCSLAQLENVTGYSRFHLAHRFMKSEGCTIGNFIQKVRIDFTELALLRGLPRKEIAFELGFSSQSNFWNWFNKHKNNISRLE